MQRSALESSRLILLNHNNNLINKLKTYLMFTMTTLLKTLVEETLKLKAGDNLVVEENLMIIKWSLAFWVIRDQAQHHRQLMGC